MEFTAEQKNALAARGRALVSAAAGSGKTAVLAERAVRYMTDSSAPVDADRLLIVTFTNAAAAEMKARISSLLRDYFSENPNPDLYRRQQYLLSIAKICTIDSFCISLVRENFHQLGIAPDFKIADMSLLAALKNEALGKTVSSLFDEGGGALDALCEALGEENAEKNLKNAIMTVYEESCNHPFPNEFLQNLRKMYADFDKDSSLWLGMILKDISERISHARSLINESKRMLTVDPLLREKYGGVVDELGAAVDSLSVKCDNRDWDGVLDCATGFSCGRLSAYKGDFQFEAEQIKKSVAMIKKTIGSISSDMQMNTADISDDCRKLSPVISKLVEAVDMFSKEYSSLKMQKNCIEFIDAEYMALKLLVDEADGTRRPSDAAIELSKFYTEVMVDEYQDVNDLQNTIFELLSDNGRKMFMVGDVKQSIYRFRNANPDIFLKNRRELPLYEPNRKNGKVIMSGNFRSAPEICDFVNSVFSILMTKDTCGMDYGAEDALVPLGSFESGVRDRVVYELLDCSDIDSYDKPKAEANEIVRQVLSQLKAPAFIPDGDTLRKARFGDIAVLLRNGNYAGEISNALTKAGIPNSCTLGGNLLKFREVTLLLSLLECINNPYRDVPTAAVMMSPLYGFTADETTKLRIDSGYSSLYSAASAMTDKDKKCSDFCSDIARYRDLARCMNIGDLLRRFCEESGYLDLVSTFRSKEQAASNVLAFINIADNFDNGPDSDLIRFLRYVRRASENDRAFGVKTKQSSVNAVKIITMHSSKGLQYPVCILAGLSQKMNRSDQTSGLQIDSKLGFGMNVCDPKRRIRYKTVAQQAIKLSKRRSQISEELCVLYVAMTRASQKLIMISSVDKLPEADNAVKDEIYEISHSDSFSQFLFIAVSGSKAHTCVVSADVSEPACKSQAEIDVTDDNRVKEISDILSYSYPYNEVNTISAKLTASGLSHSDDQKRFLLRAKPMFKKNGKMTAAQRGTVCHKFMECCDFTKAAFGVQDEIARLCDIGVLTAEQAKAILPESIDPFFKSDLYNNVISSADKIYREQRFITKFKAAEIYPDTVGLSNAEEIIVQGAADLVVLKDDILYIIDYKTDRVVNSDELIRKYKPQIRVYEKAFSKIFEKSKTIGVIYSLYLGEMINVENIDKTVENAHLM